MLKKVESPSHIRDSLNFSQAEVGDQFFNIEKTEYTHQVLEVHEMTVIRVGKRDVVATSKEHPRYELRINKENNFYDSYLEKPEVQWAIDEIVLRNKRGQIAEYIRKNAQNLSENLCDSILEQINKAEKKDEPVFAGSETGEEKSPTSSDDNLYRPE